MRFPKPSLLESMNQLRILLDFFMYHGKFWGKTTIPLLVSGLLNFYANNCFAQLKVGSWSDRTEIYSQGSTVVYVEFKNGLNVCSGGKPVNFRYHIIGNPKNSDIWIRWTVNYRDCQGVLRFTSNAVNLKECVKGESDDFKSDYQIQSDRIENKPYGVTVFQTSRQPDLPTGMIQYPITPKITGNQEVGMNEPTTLSATGGHLNSGQEWVWYEGQCGGRKIGTGNSVTVTPKKETSYFVRGEDNTHPVTDCVFAHLKIREKSIVPDRISGKQTVCKGEETTLSLDGGSLGLGANWIWYEKSVDGQRIGSGETLKVSPSRTTVYLVRAEGRNKTYPIEFKIEVFEASNKAQEIKGETNKCEGEAITLKVEGGKLAPDASWVWYENSCGAGQLGRGESITTRPSASTIYLVRAEGGCNTTDCVSRDIRVSTKSQAAWGIKHPDEVIRNRSISLNVQGGQLGSGAVWKWHQESCGTGKFIGEGESISIKPNKASDYYVQAVGKCNTTNCTKLHLESRKAHRFHSFYTPKDNRYRNKFLQVGLGIGVDWMKYSTLATTQETLFDGTLVSGNKSQEVNGIGVSAELSFHPYMKDLFGLGFIFRGTIGTTPEHLNWVSSNFTDVSYLYTRLDVSTEITLGGKPVKFLAIYRNSIQTHDYEHRTENPNVLSTIDNFQLRKEIASAGLRFAPYARNSNRRKRGVNIDLVYSLSRDYPWDWNQFTWSYTQLSSWSHGFGVGLWWHGVLKLQLDAYFFSELGTNETTNATKEPFINLSLIYNRNWFY